MRTKRILTLNKWLKDAREEKNFLRYRELVLKLHKMEHEDKVPNGTYVMR